jgi:3-hydroxyisobutyryl-CoA hydrolase
MPRLAAAAAVARRAGEALRRGALGGLRPLSSLQPSNAASSDEVTKRLVRRAHRCGILLRHWRRGVPSLTPYFAQVLVEGKASARAAVLNRPGYLNALTATMVRPHFLAYYCR